MRAPVVLLTVALCACRAGFDELPPEPIEPDPEPPASRAIHPGLPEHLVYDALVLWYELDVMTGTKFPDASGNEMIGVCKTSCPTLVPGYIGKAAQFSASTVLVDVPTLQPLTEFTIMGHIKLPTSARGCLINQDGATSFQLCATPTSVTFYTPQRSFNASAAIGVDAWVHVALRFDGETISAVVDGGQVAAINATGAVLPRELVVGGGNEVIDDLRIYSRALDDLEIEAVLAEID